MSDRPSVENLLFLKAIGSSEANTLFLKENGVSEMRPLRFSVVAGAANLFREWIPHYCSGIATR